MVRTARDSLQIALDSLHLDPYRTRLAERTMQLPRAKTADLAMVSWIKRGRRNGVKHEQRLRVPTAVSSYHWIGFRARHLKQNQSRSACRRLTKSPTCHSVCPARHTRTAREGSLVELVPSVGKDKLARI